MVDVDRIAGEGDGIVELRAIVEVLSLETVTAFQLPAFADAEGGGQGDEGEFFPHRILVAQNVHHFPDLKTALHFRTGQRVCVKGVGHDVALEPVPQIPHAREEVVPTNAPAEFVLDGA